MDVRKVLNEKLTTGVIMATIVIIVLPILYSFATWVFARGGQNERPFLEMPDAKYTECVRETEYMRFHHWELLTEMREESVRHGRRSVVTVDDCRVCHPNREQFCNRCHESVNLDPDCWGCHYYPETPDETLDDARLNGVKSILERTASSLNTPQGGDEKDG